MVAVCSPQFSSSSATASYQGLCCKGKTRRRLQLLGLNLLFRFVFKWNQFLEYKANTDLSRRVRVKRTMLTSTWAFIHKQKKRPQCSQAVLSTACQRINLSSREKKGETGSWEHSIGFSRVVTFSCLFCVILFLNQPGIVQPCCAVTRSDCDQHLKQWHSGGPAHGGSSSRWRGGVYGVPVGRRAAS